MAGEKQEEKKEEGQKVGKVTHYFGHISVAAIEITDGTLKVGDTINIKGHTSDFQQEVESMQVEHNSVQEAKKGDTIGLKVIERAHQNDVVYKVNK